MENYSTTQASNIVAVVGLLTLVLGYFKVSIPQAELQNVIGALITFGGIVWNWYHRYSRGDLTVLGSYKR